MHAHAKRSRGHAEDRWIRVFKMLNLDTARKKKKKKKEFRVVQEWTVLFYSVTQMVDLDLPVLIPFNNKFETMKVNKQM